MVQGWPQVINQLYTEVQKDREKSNAVYVEKRYRLHCANNTPRKEKRLFMIMNSISKLTTLMTYCADKFLFLALTFYILKLLFSSELASSNVYSHGYF